jgi:hypothetical protein
LSEDILGHEKSSITQYYCCAGGLICGHIERKLYFISTTTHPYIGPKNPALTEDTFRGTYVFITSA